jgi:hypothetical protein
LPFVAVPRLPPGYSARRPTLGDAEAILAVVHAAERDAIGRDDSTLAEVRELLRLPGTPPAEGYAAGTWLRRRTTVQPPPGRPRAGSAISTGTAGGRAGPVRSGVGPRLGDWHQILLASFAEHWGHEPMSLDSFRHPPCWAGRYE